MLFLAIGEINVSTPKKANNQRVPVFVSEGILYDIDYIPIKEVSSLEHSSSSGNLHHDVNPLLHSQSAPNPSTFMPSSSSSTPPFGEMDVTHMFIDSFPQPGQFDTFFDYEQSLLGWKQRMEGGLGSLRLPNVMGRKFSRPRVVEYTALEDTINPRASTSLETTIPYVVF